ncbi:MAG: DNA repair protein RecN [Blastocatellia bacterium AA13]|nr:MAG: DNA repair protein RecN [Blastocatellia bacterium AA13]
MLSLLSITNFALIEELRVEFDRGLNLLTGETGSGKSIIVDALGVLIGGRSNSDMIKAGESKSTIEGLFFFDPSPDLDEVLSRAGIEREGPELIVRREISTEGRNKTFINNQLATQGLLRELRPFLVDIHGQGDQQTLFDPVTHGNLLDAHAELESQREKVALLYKRWDVIKRDLEEVRREESERFQLLDLLKFQTAELERAGLEAGEEERLEEERRRLTNIEKLSTLCSEAFALSYEADDSAMARVGQAARRIEELAQYESSFKSYAESLDSARAVLEDLAYSLREFSGSLELSPSRLAEVEDRLAELSRLKRKYGGTIPAALEHLAGSQERLAQIERSDERERRLAAELEAARGEYFEAATELHQYRVRAAKKFEREVEKSLGEVAMENARFRINIELRGEASSDADYFTSRGIDHIEFFFSANPGEPVKPLAKVASGGEASRLMLVLKTVANATAFPRTIVFDEVDSGIGGRVSEAVGAKLKRLSDSNQVLCVTHQAQIARFADSHLLVRKEATRGRTEVSVENLDRKSRVEEIARMLTGADITEVARKHAREMLKTG